MSISENLLEIKNISKSYGKQLVLNDVSISIPQNCIFGLLGPNGAGKTTLIRIINQIIIFDAGEIFFNGQKMNREFISHIGYLPEERGLYSKMKVGEHLMYLARLKGMSTHDAKTQIKTFLEEFDIASWWNKKVEQLSKGMQQKIQFIISIMNKPELVILDEPFSGFDPLNVEIVKQKILSLRDSGTTFILSTHRMETVEELCDNIALINKANKILDGKKSEIKDNYRNNKYLVEYRGDFHGHLSGDDIFSFNQKNHGGPGSNEFIEITLYPGHTLNEALTKIMSQFSVVSVKEVIPSMQEIFVRIVNKHSNE